MTVSLQYLAPAKLNLFLHITGRREDGYHRLQTYFQLLNHGDSLRFEPAENGSLSLRTAQGALDLPMDDNLILRAARLLQDRAPGPRPGASISLEKRLPMGAGLGGGSANAAVTLTALNKLWEVGLSVAELSELGLQLGADVPVFVAGNSAWGEGVGEELRVIEQSRQLSDLWYLVITPHCAVSTAEIFSHEQLTRDSQAIKMADLLAGRIRNDCEAVTRMLYSEVDNALNWLGQFGPARMTGTGSSVFASFATQQQAQKVLDQKPEHLRGFVAQGICRLEQRQNPS